MSLNFQTLIALAIQVGIEPNLVFSVYSANQTILSNSQLNLKKTVFFNNPNQQYQFKIKLTASSHDRYGLKETITSAFFWLHDSTVINSSMLAFYTQHSLRHRVWEMKTMTRVSHLKKIQYGGALGFAEIWKLVIGRIKIVIVLLDLEILVDFFASPRLLSIFNPFRCIRQVSC